MKWIVAVFVLIAAVAIAFITFKSAPKPNEHKLRVVRSSWAPWDLMRIAQERGYFKEAGLEVDFLETTSNEDILRTMMDQRADGAFLGMDMAIRLNSRGGTNKMVVITDVSRGSEGIVARKEIKTLAELKGKRIGVTTCSCSFISLAHALKKANLAITDVTIVNLPEDSIVSAFDSHQVDAIAVWEPNLIRYEKAADAHVLITSIDFPDLILDGIAFSTEALQTRKSEISKLVSIWHRVVDEFNKDPKSFYPRLAAIEELTPAQMELILARMELGTRELNMKAFDSTTKKGLGPDAAKRNVELLKEYQQITNIPDLQDFFNLSFSRN